MSYWREVEVMSDIADNGLDGAERQKYGFNLLVVCDNPTQFEEEVARVLIAATVVTGFGTDVYSTSKAQIPVGDGPFVSITATGGPLPERTHNADRAGLPAYRRLTVQVVARAKNSKTARAKAHACFDALFAIKNSTITA